MQKVSAPLKWLIIVAAALLAAVLGACGILTYAYNKADVIPPVLEAPTLNGTPLSFESSTWTQYVCFGLKEKSLSQMADGITAVISAQVGDTLQLTAPSGYTVNYSIKMEGETTAEGSYKSIELTQVGSGFFSVTLTKQKSDKQPYGSFTYIAALEIAAKPEIKFSATECTQGQVIAVTVRNTDVQPAIETALKAEPFELYGDVWKTLLGFTYNHETGEYPVTVTVDENTTKSEVIKVTDGTFSKQYMTMSSETTDATMNVPGAAQQWRDKIWPLYETADDEIYWSGQFIWPVDGRQINTEYVLFRYVNGVYSERHAGLDIDGDTGDSVYAPANGRVVLAEYLHYTGNTIVIEHGGGLKSFLYHMDELSVNEGDMVTQGQIIGKVGTTGYSTGAHMHYEVRIANQSISPLDVLDGTSGIYFTA